MRCTKFELNSILFSIEMYIDRFIMHRVIGYWYTTSTIFFLLFCPSNIYVKLIKVKVKIMYRQKFKFLSCNCKTKIFILDQMSWFCITYNSNFQCFDNIWNKSLKLQLYILTWEGKMFVFANKLLKKQSKRYFFLSSNIEKNMNELFSEIYYVVVS